MSAFGKIKGRIIDIFVGAEKRALVDRLTRIEALQNATLAKLADVPVENPVIAPDGFVPVAKIAVDGIVSLRRSRAEQLLWDQIHRIVDLDLATPSRSVIFIHNSYYHFFYLAKALRRRGWRAVSVSLENPNGINAQYYHGEDVNMFNSDPEQFRANAEAVFEFAKRYFRLMHFAGEGLLSFFPWNFMDAEPADIVEWRGLGKKVAYTISGCKDSTAQTSVHNWAMTSTGRSLCDNCVWQDNPRVCSDAGNLAWGGKLHKYCDAIFSEMQPSLDFLSSEHTRVVRGPHTMAHDEQFWHPDLPVPAAYILPREPGEVLVYHSVGNYDFRSVGGRNIKGTPAVVRAIERLRSEGIPVRLIFFSKVPNTDVRFYQAQADIVVDQLWAGSYGANAREAMLLGKPVVGFINPFEFDTKDRLEVLETVPIVNADVDTVYEVLKDLAQSADRREAVGAASRAFAVKWHGAQACAERYELAYDSMIVRGIAKEDPVA